MYKFPNTVRFVIIIIMKFYILSHIASTWKYIWHIKYISHALKMTIMFLCCLIRSWLHRKTKCLLNMVYIN